MGEANTAAKGGKKNRKHKRSLRSPAMKRYNAERRDQTNKARRIARHTRQQARHARRKAAWTARRAATAGSSGERLLS